MITTETGESIIPVSVTGVKKRKPEEKWLDYIKRVMKHVENS